MNPGLMYDVDSTNSPILMVGDERAPLSSPKVGAVPTHKDELTAEIVSTKRRLAIASA